jgi:hypothetical protein
VVVLKQERMEGFQAARTLSAGQVPTRAFYDEARKREVKLWEVWDPNFSKTYGYGHKVGVVHSQEQWTQTEVVGGKKTRSRQTSHWWWMVSQTLRGYPVLVIYEGGQCFRDVVL